tara:strand:- start:269 stop:454 length:186 start_codon:yes stop_codon:yes gene_type:complete
MARKVYSPEEQAKMDATANARREASALAKANEEKAIRNKKLMYIGGAVLVVGIAIYLYKKV